jgi:hypothetical protein
MDTLRKVIVEVVAEFDELIMNVRGEIIEISSYFAAEK